MTARATTSAGGRRLRLGLAAAVLLAAPVLTAAPSYADTSTPTPIASEPPGGATCLPGTGTTCGQDTGVTASATASTTASASATPSPSVTTLPSTGGKPHATLAHTGAGAATGWGYTGTGLLVGGTVLVLATTRRRAAAQR